jgi:hypothetical protein
LKEVAATRCGGGEKVCNRRFYVKRCSGSCSNIALSANVPAVFFYHYLFQGLLSKKWVLCKAVP